MGDQWETSGRAMLPHMVHRWAGGTRSAMDPDY